jgi:uncharacterized phage protein (TIGR02216 family)
MLPWADMLRAALSAGIPPDAFWRLSLAEWRWMSAAAAAPARSELERLMQDYPDMEEDEK